MRRSLAARVVSTAACWLLVLAGLVRHAGAQTWNDPRSRALVEGAIRRRAEQLADTSLRDYSAVAHGYVAFLAQLGEGFRTPPKVVKADELEDEVYWRAPNLSKQRIVGRRDTLLLPTDISYHMDHLGIVPNNFPDIIRIGDGGDEVADVPNPLSAAGLTQYDFALADSFSIGSGASRIHVYEVKVRPKDDRTARVVGAVYIDPSGGQVVRMNFSFTRAAFLDKALDELSLVLENRLVAGRFWLPSRQEIEIARRGEWLDYPARGIIRGRWEIGDYKLNQTLAPTIFTGPEIVQAPPSVLAQHPWSGRILDSLPADVRAISEPDIARVQEEDALVRAQALARAQSATLSARNVSDLARFDRVEGLALGAGLSKQLGGGITATVRARYGIDDKLVKGTTELSMLGPAGESYHLFATRDFRDVGDFAERSSVVNTLAAQEFGSDYTDPYLVRAVGARVDFAPLFGFDLRFTGDYELRSGLSIHATPVAGLFEPLPGVAIGRAARFALDAELPRDAWVWGTELTVRGQARLTLPRGATYSPSDPASEPRTVRGFASATIERPFGASRLAASVSAAAVSGLDDHIFFPPEEAVYLGGPISAPGFAYHSLVSTSGETAHLEWQMPAPFPAFSLGRYGRVPGEAAIAPFVHVARLGAPLESCLVSVDAAGAADVPRQCADASGTHAAVGAEYIFPFNLLRIDVAKGFGPLGRWTFNIDVSREFWGIL